MKWFLFFSMCLLSCVSRLAVSESVVTKEQDILREFAAASPWPTIRTQRIRQLLPQAMLVNDVDVWLLVCRENDNDPLASHVGCENAGQTAVVLFERVKKDADWLIRSKIYSPQGEATALIEKAQFDEVVTVQRGTSAIAIAAQDLVVSQPNSIAVNTFSSDPQSDGLSHSQFVELTQALGQDMSKRLVAAEPLVSTWLARKLPAEVDIMKKAAWLTSLWQYQAYSSVIPGVSTDKDIADFLKQKMYQAGFKDAWSPEQNPAVNSGYDRGHSHPSDKVIMAGDVIQIDFGIKVFDRWVTDIQRFAYVLKPDERQPPEFIQHAWESARQGSRAAFEAMIIGNRGVDVDRAQRVKMHEAGSLPVMWSTGHPVGYVAHDSGPKLGDGNKDRVSASASKRLEDGMVFAFDGFYSWYYDDEKHHTKTISVEEMVVITEQGAAYLTQPQQALILIPSQIAIKRH